MNKVDTKVDIRFHLQSADWLSEDLKKNISSKVVSYSLLKFWVC